MDRTALPHVVASGQPGPYSAECPGCCVPKTRSIIAVPLSDEMRQAAQESAFHDGGRSDDARAEREHAFATITAPEPVMLLAQWSPCDCPAQEPFVEGYGADVRAAVAWLVRFEPRMLDGYTYLDEDASALQAVQISKRALAEQIQAAIGRANRLIAEHERVREDAEAAYHAALKRARIYGLAMRGEAPSEQVARLKAKMHDEWELRVVEARKRRAGLKAAVEALAGALGRV